MKYCGIDLHKKTIVVCVMNKERTVLMRKKFFCVDVKGILAWFGSLGEFSIVVEATATYEWLVQLLEPLAADWKLVNPGKMRLIAESTKKSDKLDAQILAEFLALGMIPESYRPTARQREHRKLVRYRAQCQQRLTRLKCQIRYMAASYNADHRQLFQAERLEEFRARPELTEGDRFILRERLQDYDEALKRLQTAKTELKAFTAKGSAAEQKAREILRSAPGVGVVVSEIVLAEVGDGNRFGSLKDAAAYAGLAPGKRESDNKRKDLPITKKGSRLLRWAMVEAAWSAVAHSARWRGVYEALKRRRQAKRAIIAVARRLLTVLISMLKSGTKYRFSLAELREKEALALLRENKKRAAKSRKEIAKAAKAARGAQEATLA
jgi:transposase